MKVIVTAALTSPQTFRSVLGKGVCRSYDLGIGPANEGLTVQLTGLFLRGRVTVFRVSRSGR